MAHFFVFSMSWDCKFIFGWWNSVDLEDTRLMNCSSTVTLGSAKCPRAWQLKYSWNYFLVLRFFYNTKRGFFNLQTCVRNLSLIVNASGQTNVFVIFFCQEAGFFKPTHHWGCGPMRVLALCNISFLTPCLMKTQRLISRPPQLAMWLALVSSDRQIW